jgi:hypothetical protein
MFKTLLQQFGKGFDNFRQLKNPVSKDQREYSACHWLFSRGGSQVEG